MLYKFWGNFHLFWVNCNQTWSKNFQNSLNAFWKNFENFGRILIKKESMTIIPSIFRAELRKKSGAIGSCWSHLSINTNAIFVDFNEEGPHLKPATHYSSLFTNNDKTTFLWKKLSFAKRDEKRATHYSS